VAGRWRVYTSVPVWHRTSDIAPGVGIVDWDYFHGEIMPQNPDSGMVDFEQRMGEFVEIGHYNHGSHVGLGRAG
jgi:hypothetical protein